jgi:hypothetical protein
MKLQFQIDNKPMRGIIDLNAPAEANPNSTNADVCLNLIFNHIIETDLSIDDLLTSNTNAINIIKTLIQTLRLLDGSIEEDIITINIPADKYKSIKGLMAKQSTHIPAASPLLCMQKSLCDMQDILHKLFTEHGNSNIDLYIAQGNPVDNEAPSTLYDACIQRSDWLSHNFVQANKQLQQLLEDVMKKARIFELTESDVENTYDLYIEGIDVNFSQDVNELIQFCCNSGNLALTAEHTTELQNLAAICAETEFVPTTDWIVQPAAEVPTSKNLAVSPTSFAPLPQLPAIRSDFFGSVRSTREESSLLSTQRKLLTNEFLPKSYLNDANTFKHFHKPRELTHTRDFVNVFLRELPMKFKPKLIALESSIILNLRQTTDKKMFITTFIQLIGHVSKKDKLLLNNLYHIASHIYNPHSVRNISPAITLKSSR